MTRAFLLTVGLLLSAPVVQAQDTLPAADFDSLSACSIVYNRIGGIYGERGDTAQATSFQETALAYSASAFHTLSLITEDQDSAYAWAEDRMLSISASLNASSETKPNKEMGVIEEWLPFCDTLGGQVDMMLAAREEGGW